MHICLIMNKDIISAVAVKSMFVLFCRLILGFAMMIDQLFAFITNSKPPHCMHKYYAHIVALCHSVSPISPFYHLLMLTCTQHIQLHTSLLVH